MQTVTSDLLNKISACIVESIQPDKIVLFGSYAWGVPHKDSDVDLFVVVASSDQPSYKRARAVYHSLRDISVPFDVIVQTQEELERSVRIPSSFAYKVMESGKVLYG
ncbi:MAG: nucleotidyltransferase domain-containing protein [Zetaproteobacteria bacterium]|nr:nucleotidyltransferase domain-containing protein [Zetaproteobacteria bacterium]